MKRIKFVVKVGLWILSVALFLFAILVAHIHTVSRAAEKKKSVLPGELLGRIDFRQDIDSATAADIRTTVGSLPGIKSTYFNQKDDILVYSYDPAKQTTAAVFELLISSGDYKAERFTAKAGQKSGCPVDADDDSFAGRIVSGIRELVN